MPRGNRCGDTEHRASLPNSFPAERLRNLRRLGQRPDGMTELRPEGSLEGRIVRVEPIEEGHREGLREAAERDPEIHRYTNMYSLGFDRWFDLALASDAEIPFVVHVEGRPVGAARCSASERVSRGSSASTWCCPTRFATRPGTRSSTTTGPR